MMWIVGSMAAGLLLSLTATWASFVDWDRRFEEQAHYQFRNEYRVPPLMMLASGLGVVPIAGVLFGLSCWIAYFSRKEQVK